MPACWFDFRALDATLGLEGDVRPTRKLRAGTQSFHQGLESFVSGERDRPLTGRTRADPKDLPTVCQGTDQPLDHAIISLGVTDDEEGPRPFPCKCRHTLDQIVRNRPGFVREYPIVFGTIAIAVRLR